MAGLASSLFASLSAGWVPLAQQAAGLLVVGVVYRAMKTGQFDYADLVSKFLAVWVALYLAGDYGAYKYWIYDTASQFISGTSAQIIGAGGAVSGVGTAALLQAVETACMDVISVGLSMIADAGWKVGIYAAALFLVAPFLAIVIVFAGYVAWASALLLVPLAFGPVFAVLGAFKATRKFMIGGIDFIVHAAALVLISSLWVGLVVGAVRRLKAKMPLSAGGEIDASTAATFAFGPAHMGAVVIGCICLGLMTKVPSMASILVGRPSDGAIGARLASWFASAGGGKK